MTDPNQPEGTEAGSGPIDPGRPIEELAILAKDPVPDIAGPVVEEINLRMLGGQILEVQWWGLTSLIREYLSFALEDAADDPEPRKEL